MAKQKQEKVRVFALGGVSESGNNMYVVEVNDDILVLDAGSMLPENEMLGIDVVIPDIQYLLENIKRVRGIFLTHGHEGHVGALPFILDRLKVPVYGTALTINLVKNKLDEAGFSRRARLMEIDPNQEVRAGRTSVSFFRTDHSIPDSVGICVHTKCGAVVYTGDFKFDIKSETERSADLTKLAEIGSRGVLCLLSDSTNAQLPGVSDSEIDVARHMVEAFYKAKGRMIVACTALNLHRIQQVFHLAKLHNRKIKMIGRHVEKVVQTASRLGFLHETDQLIINSGVKQLDDERLVLLTSGNQSGPVWALAEWINSKDQSVAIKAGDTVVIADDPVLGNERKVARTIDELVRAGAEVVYDYRKPGDSGHAFAEELKLMITMMKPKYFIPIHGEYRMMKAHSRLAEAVGIPEKHIFIAEKGEVVEMVRGEAGWGGKVPSGKVLVDGKGVGDVGNIVLRDRKLLAEDGILLVVVTLGRKSKQIISGPEIISRGFVYVRESEKLLQEAGRIVSEVLEKALGENRTERTSLKTGVRDTLSQYLFDKTRRSPMILPIIMEV